MMSKAFSMVAVVILLAAVAVSAAPGKRGHRRGPPKPRPCSVDPAVRPNGEEADTVDCDEGFTCTLGPFTHTNRDNKTKTVTFCVGLDNKCPIPNDAPEDRPDPTLQFVNCTEVQVGDEGYSTGKPVCNAEGKYVVYNCPEGEGPRGGPPKDRHREDRERGRRQGSRGPRGFGNGRNGRS